MTVRENVASTIAATQEAGRYLSREEVAGNVHRA